LLVVSPRGMRQSKMHIAAKQIRTAFDMRSFSLAQHLWKRQNEVLIFAMLRHVREIEQAFALGRPAASKRQQLRKLAIRASILGITENASPTAQIEPTADNESRTQIFRFLKRAMRKHNAGERITIRNRNRMMPVFIGRVYQLLR